MGGYAGLATAAAFATEFQGDGTGHGHGFVSLANMYQFNSLETIAQILEHNIHGLSPEEMVERITNFIEHLQREDHFNDELHQSQVNALEEEFHKNNAGPTKNIHLCVRPQCTSQVDNASYLWSSTKPDVKAVQSDAARFTDTYENDVQFVFSHVQHHWHKLDRSGQRQPLKYCMLKGRKKKSCKAGFPRKVIRDQKGKLVMEKYRARIVCRGVAAEMDLKVSGRRNMLGAILCRRRCAWFAACSAILAHLTRSNTNLQVPYRLPIKSVIEIMK